MQTSTLNPLRQLAGFGQAFWLDYIRREFTRHGGLRRLVEEDGLRGVTSNPSILEKAMEETEYRQQIQGATCEAASSSQTIFDHVAVRDVRDAADVLRPVYDATGGADGFVSLEVGPFRAHDTEGTIADARRLFAEVNRPNVMIKVPATAEGVPAIEELLFEGININITLLFGVERYVEVARGYVRALKRRAAKGLPVSLSSVASFFVSRIDSAVDKLLEEKANAAPEPERASILALRGKIAIANAKHAYRRYQEIFSGEEWKQLAAAGARVQRLLWASTSTKNHAYSDVLYIEELLGPDTVNTIPPATADAFRGHGKLRNSLTENWDEANRELAQLERLGISLTEVTDGLLAKGVELFQEAIDKVLASITRLRADGPAVTGSQQLMLPAALGSVVESALAQWEQSGASRKLWQRDASVWTGDGEDRWLGWLDIVDQQIRRVSELTRFGEEIRAAGFKDVIVLGMGGSSLCPEVLGETFGRQEGFPRLRIVDSTDPGQIRDTAGSLDLKHTLFIVSSKSGSTLEPNILKEYFFKRQQEATGAKDAPLHFVAITDPGSPFEKEAKRDGFRHIFHGVPQIGGRYSALSDFGMAPAAAMGLDVYRFLERAEVMMQACAPCIPAKENPGVVLGTVMGALANHGRDKITLVTSPAINGLGAWLEQLIAESTGKQGKGIIPVDREPLTSAEHYGADRFFVYIRYASAPDAAQDAAIGKLAAAGMPVVRIELNDLYDLGQEFFRWEMATAVAGKLIGINPFNQPDVEASKVAARKLATQYEETGKLVTGTPLYEEGSIALYADAANASELRAAAGGSPTLVHYLKAHLKRLHAGDYFALLAYLNRNAENDQLLQAVRAAVRDATGRATCAGFGPRFLHSTGQAYKGGPNSGVFIQITGAGAEDLPIPGRKYTFGIVKAAQAQGDLEVLSERKRRALRVHLGSDTRQGLAALVAAIRIALANRG
ncbi:MAG: bifunctional transaldolase/phosoglucose isomerase [Bryobacterales bacterium]|nr:bifunctional transaldolase/phosoglucose isomerase [Bryobacterales bacterium]